MFGLGRSLAVVHVALAGLVCDLGFAAKAFASMSKSSLAGDYKARVAHSADAASSLENEEYWQLRFIPIALLGRGS
jgi:hypothetical protein